MTIPYTLTMEETPDRADIQTILEGLRDYNRKRVGSDDHRELAIVARDGEGRVIGGLLGDTYWGWLHIAVLWVAESLRGRGVGRRLMLAAEEEGRRRGCRYAHVDTMDFQAPEFYQELGYAVWGELRDIPAGTGHKRVWFWKEMAG